MPSAFRYQNVATWTIGTTVAASALLVGVLYRTGATAQTIIPPPAKSGDTLTQATPSALTGEFWAVLQARAEKTTRSAPGNPVADRFRLAGTFSIDGLGAPQPQHKAILDDSVKRDQFIVAEGDRLDEVMVKQIYYDHVVLETPSGVRELWLEFAGRAPTGSVAIVTNQLVAGSGFGGTNRFGCLKTQDNRWQFSRKPLLDYYQELLDEPDRMVAVFDTMKPVRDDRNKITGYVVGLEGEKDFFDAVGLQQGDIVRSVNSVAMTHRRRAESFIDQFLKDKMNAVVLEVERDGKVVKQVYQMRP